jgi:hypothetical protein
LAQPGEKQISNETSSDSQATTEKTVTADIGRSEDIEKTVEVNTEDASEDTVNDNHVIIDVDDVTFPTEPLAKVMKNTIKARLRGSTSKTATVTKTVPAVKKKDSSCKLVLFGPGRGWSKGTPVKSSKNKPQKRRLAYSDDS